MNKVLISTLCSGREYVKFLIGFFIITNDHIYCFLYSVFLAYLLCQKSTLYCSSL